MNKEEQYDDLTQEFLEQRNALKSMVKDLEEFKSKIDQLLPNTLDKRYMRFFEEKIKTVTELFKAILDIRKEISKIAKDEFELRRKISSGDDEDIEGLFDIKKIADRVDRIRKDKILLEQKVEENIPEENSEQDTNYIEEKIKEDSEKSNEIGRIAENG